MFGGHIGIGEETVTRMLHSLMTARGNISSLFSMLNAIVKHDSSKTKCNYTNMPSNAYTNHLVVLLEDARELQAAHKQLRTGLAGRQWRLGALNRAAIVLTVSSWEAYLEEVVREGLEALRPLAPPLGVWPALNASVRGDLGRFNTPNADNTRKLFLESFGIPDITDDWHWNNCTPTQARDILNKALTKRHHIAHGVNPRPTIHNVYARGLPGVIRRLAQRTDKGIKRHFQTNFHITLNW
jgi:hypothetical protein